MDRAAGAAPGGTFMCMSEKEQRRYSGLYTLCQADSSGKLAPGKVGELFRASQLPADTLHQIAELCGAKQLGYFGTGQFYVALKLLAAAQAGLPVRLESIKNELPLPRFSDMKEEAESHFHNHSQNSETQSHHFGLPLDSTPRAMTDRRGFRRQESSAEKKEPWSPPRSPCGSPPASPPSSHGCSLGTQRNGAEAHAAQMPGGSGWVHAQLETSSPSHSGNKPHPEHTSVGAPVERPGEQDAGMVDYADDPWRITEEQREYYTHQFKSLQPNLGALILGSVAKNFFTKSKLPILELSHIWELSDVDRDGALTLTEFCIAFHLIVARKNGYPLPETLPLTLLPRFLEKDAAPSRTANEDVFFAMSLAQQKKDPPLTEKTEPLIFFGETEPGLRLQNETDHQMHLSVMTLSKQDLREEPSKSVFSPKRIQVTTVQDKPPVHRSTEKPDPPPELDPHVRSRTRPRSYSSASIEEAMKKTEEPPTPPPRPQKTHSRASSLDLNKLFQQSGQGLKSGHLLPPPALPPRPMATQIPHFISGTDKSSQKAVQQPNFADFSKFQEEEENAIQAEEQNREDAGPLRTPPQKPVRRKYRTESQVLDSLQPFPSPSHPLTGSKPPQKLSSRQKKEIQTAIRKNKETNAVLTRLNSELQQQLKEVHQERVNLESQLEVLRPVAFL
ncbi:ralBP1-associated Eps domain-containing protein 2 isoform X1 [Scleropages formosus]|uniref:RalBP1-associated Eps domain-containing protein 2-like n=1 Tax=Scleropages formosus TaxID=113540 RepID=A0A8C9R2Y7_SCLFO|nr:ralBP1-associated Eps domain-containing protein 2-like isoform X1 [Scleropages formosus]